MNRVLTGQCVCADVRFEVADAFLYAGYCHCSQCRTATGSAFSTFAGIDGSKLTIISGSGRINVFRSRDGDRINFCATCGTQVFTLLSGSELAHVPFGALREAPQIQPGFHAFVGSKAPWYEINDGLPQYLERAPAHVMIAPADAAGRARAALSRQSSRSEYSRRLNRVFEYIDAHLDEQIDLEAVARVANFSPFHFHRVFAAWMGETPGDYLRGRRLDRAADRLATDPDASVLAVALAVGFGSGEAFARAFKVRFGCTPTIWRTESPSVRIERVQMVRAERNLGQFQRKAGQASTLDVVQHERSDQFFEELNMHVKVVDFPATRVAFLRNVGPLGTSVGAFWVNTVFPWLAANGLADKPRFGIGLDNPMVTPPEKYRYDACVEVPEDFVAKVPAGINVLPQGRYAVRSFNGTAANIGAAWNEVFRDWLPSSAMQMDERPMIEYYPGGSKVDAKTGMFECELWVPVKPL